MSSDAPATLSWPAHSGPPPPRFPLLGATKQLSEAARTSQWTPSCFLAGCRHGAATAGERTATSRHPAPTLCCSNHHLARRAPLSSLVLPLPHSQLLVGRSTATSHTTMMASVVVTVQCVCTRAMSRVWAGLGCFRRWARPAVVGFGPL
jgi:hypothetical protein